MEEYIQQINTLEAPTFQQIREIAKRNCGCVCNGNINNCKPWKYLDHGVALLDTHENLCKYFCAYGEMHEEKMKKSFAAIPNSQNIFNQDITIIDWGCGQGLATVCFFDYLNQENIQNKIKKVILIEPSEMALDRAKLHVNVYLKDDNKIQPVNKFLDDVIQDDLQTDTPIVLHFFSNILDIKDIDLKKLAQKVGENQTYDQYFSCVGPLNYGNNRIEAFYRYFKEPKSLANNEINQLPKTKKTLKLLVFKLEAGRVNLIQIEYYPPMQFHAGYQLDCVKQIAKTLSDKDKQKYDLTTAFEVAAPFDIGASIYDDVQPIFAVLNNIVTRGLPTRTSPFIEQVFEKFGNQRIKDDLGNIIFKNDKFQTNSWLSSVEYLTPIAVAHVQKTILEALMTDKISIDQGEWNVLVTERDVPCAAIAFEDLRHMFNHLTALSKDYAEMKFPKVNLEIIGKEEYINSPLHLDIKPSTECNTQQRFKEYDMVIDVSVLQQSDITRVSFSEFNCKNNCYFNIRSARRKRINRYIYTSDTIEYRPLVTKDAQGNYNNIVETKEHLNYFLQLLFRKEDFRPGQLPILDRALRNESVIGLLPTGGGKSLTYQLAAMLQPGVTIVIDPLRSLMKDQYDGLINNGIDTCTFINSTLDAREKELREKQMESSQMQFIFLSPERLCIYKFRERLRTMRDLHVYFAYGVIDEVHCVSEWGHDFRFSYLHLGRNLYNYVCTKNQEKRLTLFGLTATASFDVLADVERELSGDGAFPLDANTIIRYENTNRLELQYKVEKVPIINARDKFGVYDTKREFLKNYISQIPQYIGELQTEESLDRIKKSFSVRQGNIEQTDTDLHTQFDNNFCEQKNTYPQAGIIFCPHKDNTGISVFRNETSLHKNIPSIGTFIGSSNNDDEQDRKSFENLDKFKNNESPLMVATKAFGMGIDKPNVRFTINMNYSSSLESFVQEAGRAGRDRKMALSVILYADNFDADLDTVMYFYNNNFKGKDVEKQTMHWLLSKSPTPVFYEDNSEYKDTETVNHFLSLLLSMPEGTVIVAFISYVFRDLQNNLVKQIEIYKEQRVTKSIAINVTTGIRKVQLQNGEVISVTKEDIITIDKAGIAKAIYRMCSIGLISDFTEDYANKRYRIVAVRKADGEYYQGIKRFLMRYYSADRAEEERQKVPHYKGENEIHKCLGYLTEFIYEKIAVKRKRAIDDMRTFCIQGIDKNKDWKKINEELKDFIYYYFNSKYAKDDYVADKGGPFSLTKDTDEGKKSSPDIVFKYMRVVDDLVDIDGTPKDNVKHLQGAVRLIRRSLTDTNPALDLLNAFCLFYLGTNNNETLEEELRNSYQEGLNRFSDLTSNYEYFWNFFDDFNKNIPEKAGEFPADKFNDIKEKVTIAIHAKIIRSLTNKYTEK